MQRRAARLATVAALALEAALLIFMVARSAQWLTYPATLTNTQTFNAYHDYGYPLSVLQGGDATLAQLQTQTGAAQVEALTASDPRYQLPEDYILAGERADRLSLPLNCLALPPADARPWLVAPVVPASPADALLGTLPNARQVGSLPMVGGPAYPVYQVSGKTPLLAGEVPLTPTTFDDHHGDALRLMSASVPQLGVVMLRWQIVAANAPADQTRQFRIVASAAGASASTDCAAQRWQPGETLFTWIPLRADGTSDLAISALTTTIGLQEPSALGLHFLSDAPINAPFTPATAASTVEPAQANVAVKPDGSLTIPVRTLFYRD